MNKTKFILASQSPRRQELLELLHIDFHVVPSHIDEIIRDELTFDAVVMDIALQKATHIGKQHPGIPVLGFDTLVIVDDVALGKPSDRDEAFQMLRTLSDRTHTVLSGCALVCDDEIHTIYDQADVTFYPMTDEEINEYLDTNEPFDKAGAYGIQGYGAKYIKQVHGDYYSVMGVPLSKLYQLLRGLS